MKIIKERKDCTFLSLSKRMNRFMECIPEDWAEGYENVVACCTVENQENADKNARVLNYDWVLDIREQCVRKNVDFTFRQCGSHFLKDGKLYNLQVKNLGSQARKANMDYRKREG